MSSPRNTILSRVRRAQLTGRIPGYGADRRGMAVASPSTPRERPLVRPRREVCFQRFLDELTLLGVDYHVEISAADVRARVAAIVGSRSVLRWDWRHLPYEIGPLWPKAADGTSPR